MIKHAGLFRGVLIALLVATVLVLVAFVSQKRRYDRAYDAVLPGMAKSEVLKRFGKPRYLRKCTLAPSWDADPLDKQSSNCVEEVWYFSRISPEQWVIGFDQNGNAVTKYHLVSP